MNNRKFTHVAKEASQAFSITTSITCFFMSIFSSTFHLPDFVGWVSGLGTGLIAACFGGANALEEENERERQEQQALQNNNRFTSTTRMITVMNDDPRVTLASNVHEFPSPQKDEKSGYSSNDRFFNDDESALLNTMDRSDEPAPGLAVKRLKHH